MILDLEKLFPRNTRTAPFRLEKTDWPGEAIDPSVRVLETVAEGEVTAEGTLVRAAGQVTFRYQTVCARCLTPVAASCTADFDEEFARRESEEYPDRYLYEGQTLDLSQMVEDCIALHMPLRTLCREDCKGLCPVCGADRNVRSCTCSTGEDPDVQEINPFAVLAAKLREENEEV